MIGYLNGTVEKLITGNFNGVGVVVTETYKGRDGEQRTSRVVAWFNEDPGLEVGDYAMLSGVVGGKTSTDKDGNVYLDNNGKTRVELQLNAARVRPAQEVAMTDRNPEQNLKDIGAEFTEAPF